MKAFEHQESPESRLRVRAGELGKFGGNTGWGFGFMMLARHVPRVQLACE